MTTQEPFAKPYPKPKGAAKGRYWHLDNVQLVVQPISGSLHVEKVLICHWKELPCKEVQP